MYTVNMKDQVFKDIKHKHVNSEYSIYSNGGELETGYKPDFVLKSLQREDYIILENEHSSSRKHIIGGLIKAAKFLTGDKSGLFIVVLREKDNTKKQQIANQLNTYFNWINSLTNLKYGYVIYDYEYISENGKQILIESERFMEHAIIFR